MNEQPGSSTSLSLLVRLKNNSADAVTWDEFVSRYGGKINRWCRNWGLQAADADDVTQNVLLALSKQMRSFEYRADGRFRSWLKTVAYRAWCRFHEERQRAAVAIGTDAVDQLLASVEAREEFLHALDQECEKNMLEDAMLLVRERVKTSTWQAFHLTAIENRNAADVGTELEMSVVAVYRARSRVQSMIREEVQLLEGEPDRS